ncbi:hypothetical protein SAY87_015757 [Trapa incisa]|uniref:F-box domain-containing protein n=1 Tax=Trapa incisa TaxID=236973 RepID=A0AAN7L5P6_9MYRT|nr:hypothetical protein SAY87_015757 [Trapa incisa]
MEVQTENSQVDEVELPLPGEVVELVLSYVPLVDLVSASHVSRSWCSSVSSSLLLNRPRPWLIIHCQTTRPPYAVTVHAFDPRSRLWMDLQHRNPSADLGSTLLRSQSGRLLYALSPCHFSFSLDPLGLSWHRVSPPFVWRPDPIVAAAGSRIVVAGGGCDFDDDPLAVEIYDLEERKWESCDTMPSALRDCSTSACLSVAAGRGRIYVAEKLSGEVHSFDPEAKEWHGPYGLRPDRNIHCSLIDFLNNRMILIGLTNVRDRDSPSHPSQNGGQSLKIWEVLGLFSESEYREISEMPRELLKEIKGDGPSIISSISVCSAGDMVYLYNPSNPETVAWCMVAADGGTGEWGSIRIPANRQGCHAGRTVLSCWNVGVPELERALANSVSVLS